MAIFKLDQNSVLTDADKKALANAKQYPVVYDEDSPALSDAMEAAFMQERRKKPYNALPLTLYVSPETLSKAKAIGDDYPTVLGHLLDKAIETYIAM